MLKNHTDNSNSRFHDFTISRMLRWNRHKSLHFYLLSQNQSGFQSGLETAPLAAVSAGYCHFLGQFQAKSRTDRDIS